MIITSVRHTGTQFYLWFLSRHPNIGNCPQEDRLPKSFSVYGDGRVSHIHIGENHEINQYIVNIIPEQKIMIPLRDPVLSILTHKKRKSNPMLTVLEGLRVTAHFVTDGFRMFAKMDDHQVLFVPIDQAWCVYERIVRLREIEDHYGIPHDKVWVQTYAEEWTVRNSMGITDIKEQYLEGDFQAVYDMYPDDMQYLLNHKDAIVPFLKRHGYEHLPWY